MSGVSSNTSVDSHMCYLLDITPSQWRLLNTMLEMNTQDPISCKQLQDTLDLDSSYVSRNLSRLMNKGLVLRKYHFVGSSSPRYCYKPLPLNDIQLKINNMILDMSAQLEAVGLCVRADSEGNDGIKQEDS